MRPTKLSYTATGAVASQAVPVDVYTSAAEFGLQLTTTGVAVSVQATTDNVFDSAVTPNWFALTSTAFTSATSSVQGSHNVPVRAFRLNPSGAGTFSLTVVQQGTR